MSTSYWMIVGDDHVAAGHTLSDRHDEGDVQVVADPRTFDLGEIQERFGHDGVIDIIRNEGYEVQGGGRRPVLRLAEVTPLGEVARCVYTGTDDNGNAYRSEDDYLVTCAGGWRVVGMHPLDAVFGPQAGQIREVIAEAERELVLGTNQELIDAYMAVVNARYSQGRVGSSVEPLLEAAGDALDAVGADGWSWARAANCVYGEEVTALAARDLIGTTAEWTRDTYDALTLPWRTAFNRPPHPDDIP